MWWPPQVGGCFSIVVSDSPTRVRNLLAIWLRAFRTSSFLAACACSRSRMSSGVAVLARNPKTYWLPRWSIEPSSTAALAVRSQISLVQLRSEPRICRLAHQTQRPLDALVGDEAEERGLFQLHRQSLAKRSIKYRVASLILEIGQDNGVLLGESRGTVKIKICRGEHRQNKPQRPKPISRGFLWRSLPASLPPPARRRIATGVRDLPPNTGSRFFPASVKGCASAGIRVVPRSAFHGGRGRTSRYRSGRRPVCPPFAPGAM